MIALDILRLFCLTSPIARQSNDQARVLYKNTRTALEGYIPRTLQTDLALLCLALLLFCYSLGYAYFTHIFQGY